MEALLNLEVVQSIHNVKALRRLYDDVETHIRGLRTLGIDSDSYGSLLSSLLLNKIPAEMKLLISRSTESEGWELDTILTHIEKEIEARERANTVNPSNLKKPPRENPTAVSLVASNPETLSCCYCRQPHPTKGCTNVVQVGARKEILRKSGRCYVC